MNRFFYFSLALSLLFTACDKDDEQYYKLKPNDGGTMELQGGTGGAMAKNSVYVDFSTGQQSSVERASWHLALYCGSEFGVRLNNTIGSRATEAATGTALNTVIDQQGCDNYIASLVPTMGSGDFTTADKIDSDTDLSGTVIKKNKIYIYCSGDEGGKELYKIQVTEKSSDIYTISYALWNSTEVKTLDITKNTACHFMGVSFTQNKQVNVQPAKEEWDIVWGRNTFTSAAAAGVPFMISDLVFLNTKAGVKAREVLVAEKGSYDDFTAEKATSFQLSSDIGVIGSNWRNGGGPNAAPSVKTDRFYLIQDVQGNIYKLGFVSMNEGADGGRRGYPEIKYALLIEAK